MTHPQPDWSEQDGDEVVASVLAVARRGSVCVAGLSSQRASAVCWDRRDGRPLWPIFSWQDRRAHAWIDQLAPYGASVHAKTGLFLSSHYGASKLRWALDHLPAVREAMRARTLA